MGDIHDGAAKGSLAEAKSRMKKLDGGNEV